MVLILFASPVATALATGIANAGLAYAYGRFVRPKLFPQDPVEGPRLGDIDQQTAKRGTAMKRPFGSSVRVAGAIMWMGELNEVRNERSSGGKGGGRSADYVEYVYYIDAAISIGEVGDYPMERMTRLFADGDEKWDAETPDVQLAADSTYTWGFTTRQVLRTEFVGGMWIDTTNYEMVIESDNVSPPGSPPLGDEDLGRLVSGNDCQIAGFGLSNDGAYKVLASGRGDQLGGGLRRSFAILDFGTTAPSPATGTGVSTATIIQQNNLKSSDSFESIEVYDGSRDQLPDPTIEAAEGVGTVPAFRGMALYVLKQYRITDHGNRLPNFEAFASMHPKTHTVAGAIEIICESHGVEHIDVSAVTALCKSYVPQGPQTGGDKLEPLMLAHNLAVRDQEGVLVFEPRDQAPVESVPESALAAREPGEEPSDRHARVRDLNRERLPTHVTVTYLDVESDLATGAKTEVYPKGSRGLTEHHVQIDLGTVGLTGEEAAEVAARYLWSSRAASKALQFTVTPDHIGRLKAGRLVDVEADGVSYRLLAEKVDRGRNYIHVVEGTTQQVRSFTQPRRAETPPPFSEKL